MHFFLETERLKLRKFEDNDEDAALIYGLNSDPEVLKYLHEPTPTSIDQASKILRNIILPQYALGLGRWAVYIKDGNEFIGWCGLKFRKEIQETDLGYRFKKTAWGKGFATEAAIACLKYGLENLALQQITGRAQPENTASIKILQKIGMQYIGEEFLDGLMLTTYRAYQPNPEKTVKEK